MLESHRNLLAIRVAFESENEAAKERLQILENNLVETRMELLRTKMELAESRSTWVLKGSVLGKKTPIFFDDAKFSQITRRFQKCNS